MRASLLLLFLAPRPLHAEPAPTAAPETSSSTSTRKGAEIYGRMCAVCHGANGEGYKADRAPMLANQEFLTTVTDAFLAQAIRDGRAGTTMSSWGAEYGGPLSQEDIDAVIAFIRGWEKGSRPVLDEKAVTGSEPKGTAIFTEKCARCHGPRGIGGPNIRIGDLGLLKSASDGFLRHAIEKGRPGTEMAAYGSSLGDKGVEDILAALRAWQSTAALSGYQPRGQVPPIPLGPVPMNPVGYEPEGFRAFPEMTPGDVVKAQFDRHARFAILDARNPTDYVKEHIIGAVSVPFYAPEQYILLLPKDAWLVCYCGCPHAESGNLARKLMSAGFTKVTVLDEGIGYWKSKNYPTKTGREP